MLFHLSSVFSVREYYAVLDFNRRVHDEAHVLTPKLSCHTLLLEDFFASYLYGRIGRVTDGRYSAA